MLFKGVLIAVFLCLFCIGLLVLALIFAALWRGYREMGHSHNTNSLGLDLSYSDQHNRVKKSKR